LAEARAAKGRDLRSKVSQIRYEASSRERHGDVVWLDLAVSQNHMIPRGLTLMSAGLGFFTNASASPFFVDCGFHCLLCNIVLHRLVDIRVSVCQSICLSVGVSLIISSIGFGTTNAILWFGNSKWVVYIALLG
jgi:hypothetical protein